MKKFVIFIAFAVVHLIDASQENKPLSKPRQLWEMIKSDDAKSQVYSFVKGFTWVAGGLGGAAFRPHTRFNAVNVVVTVVWGDLIIRSPLIISRQTNVGAFAVGSYLGLGTVVVLVAKYNPQ